MQRRVASSFYHRSLRVVAVMSALVLVFGSNSLNYIYGASQYTANVIGTEINADELDLQKSGTFFSGEIGQGANNKTTFIIATVLFLVLLLMTVNYTVDYLRYQKVKVSDTNHQAFVTG